MYVHPAVFIGLLVLKCLELRHTQLHQLPSLQEIRHSLTYVEVSYSNVEENCARTFTYLKIKHLVIHHNVLSITPLGLNVIASTIITLEFEFHSINALTSMEGVEFIKLARLGLRKNNITHLHLEFLITPRLESLNLVGNPWSHWQKSLSIHGAVHCQNTHTWQFIWDRIPGTVMGR